MDGNLHPLGLGKWTLLGFMFHQGKALSAVAIVMVALITVVLLDPWLWYWGRQ
jgi:hypothetical protein